MSILILIFSSYTSSRSRGFLTSREASFYRFMNPGFCLVNIIIYRNKKNRHQYACFVYVLFNNKAYTLFNLLRATLRSLFFRLVYLTLHLSHINIPLAQTLSSIAFFLLTSILSSGLYLLQCPHFLP